MRDAVGKPQQCQESAPWSHASPARVTTPTQTIFHSILHSVTFWQISPCLCMGKHICQGQIFHNKTFVTAGLLGQSDLHL